MSSEKKCAAEANKLKELKCLRKQRDTRTKDLKCQRNQRDTRTNPDLVRLAKEKDPSVLNQVEDSAGVKSKREEYQALLAEERKLQEEMNCLRKHRRDIRTHPDLVRLVREKAPVIEQLAQVESVCNQVQDWYRKCLQVGTEDEIQEFLRKELGEGSSECC
uniref:Uncharacterized protein n=1 Tax=Cacopsylla melanoneura TaxID=428564 RepID=A0A8D9BDM6_9HEMI